MCRDDLWRSEIGCHLVGVAAGLADVGDDGVGFRDGAPVVNQDLRSGRGKSERAGAADAAGAPVTRVVFPMRSITLDVLSIVSSGWSRGGRSPCPRQQARLISRCFGRRFRQNFVAKAFCVRGALDRLQKVRDQARPPGLMSGP
jgi:hypothetical protein